MKRPVIVVQGSLNYDFIVKGKKLPQKGETVTGSLNQVFSGGKGANQAVQMAKLGAEVYLIGRIGDDDPGRFLLRELKSAGVNTDYLTIDDHGTGIACIQCDENGDNYIVVIPNGNGQCCSGDVIRAENVIRRADICVCQLETTDEAVDCFMAISTRHGAPVVLDPAPARKVEPSFFKRSFMITPNETETEFYTGIPAEDVAAPAGRAEAAELLMEKGAGRVVITLGSAGSYYKDKNCDYFCPSFSVNAADTTAAGDAFTGALCYAVATRMKTEDSLRYANAAGALAASKMGAQASMANNEEIKKLIEGRF